MEEVSRLLAGRKFTGTRLRPNIVPEAERSVYVHPVKGTKLNTTRKAIQSDMIKAGTPLWEAVAEIAPENATWNSICVNKNIKCEPHVDKNNIGNSWILFLGDFTGGALCFADSRCISERGKWHEFDGKIQHWNDPHEGTKFSIILYTRLCTTRPKTAPRRKNKND